MRKRSIPWTRLAALPLTLLLVVCAARRQKPMTSPRSVKAARRASA